MLLDLRWTFVADTIMGGVSRGALTHGSDDLHSYVRHRIVEKYGTDDLGRASEIYRQYSHHGLPFRREALGRSAHQTRATGSGACRVGAAPR